MRVLAAYCPETRMGYARRGGSFFLQNLLGHVLGDVIPIKMFNFYRRYDESHDFSGG